MQTREQLAHLIDVAAGRIPADTVIRNCKIVDVYAGEIVEGVTVYETPGIFTVDV